MRDGQVVQLKRGARVDQEHLKAARAIDRDILPHAIDCQCVLNRRQRTAQGDDAAHAEVDGVCARPARAIAAAGVAAGVGIVDRLAQAAEAVTRCGLIICRVDD